MAKKPAKDKLAALYPRSEEALQEQPVNLADLSVADIQALLHSLQVHQMELELQNEDLREAQLELQIARDRYADLYNFAPVGYFTLDIDGAIIEANLTGANLLGVARSALVGTSFTRFVVKEDRERYALYRVRLGTSDGPPTIELRLGRLDGAEFYARLEGLAAYDEEGKFKQSRLTISDITARKQAEEALHESEEKYRTFFQSSLDAILLTSPDGSIQAANPAACKMFGRTEAEFCSLGRSSLADPDDPRLKALLAERARTAKVLGELTMLRQDGSPFPAELSSALFQDRHGNTRTSMIIRDITARKRAEEALHRYTERLRNLHELDLAIVAARSPEAIVQTTLKRLRHLIPCRRASVILFDFEAHEALVLTVEVSGETRVPAGLRQPLPTDWVAALQQGQTLGVVDTLALAQPLPLVKMLTDDGIRSCINVPLLAGSELLGVVNLGSDLPGAFKAEYIEMAEEATIVLAIALQQARLHEQVSRARERLEVLSHRLLEAQETERRHLARELHDEIGQTLSMVKIDLQTMQQLPQARPLAAQLGESISLVERALHQVRALSVELRPSLLDDLGLIPALRWYVDRQAQRGGFTARFVAAPLQARLTSELETVCYRLVQEALTNVVRYAQARQVEVELQQREAELCLFIRDDGLGFDVAAALKQVMQGTSLGLLSMQERVSLVGGQIEIKSAPRQGTVIQARLPLKYAPPVNFD